MKKNQRNSKPLRADQTTIKQNSNDSAFEIDNSLDDIFRFDDKLVGKRTNAVFQTRPANDGFFDIAINSDLNSKLSKSNFSSELSFSNVNPANDAEEKKNLRMIRMIQSFENQASAITISELTEMGKLVPDDHNKDQFALSLDQSQKRVTKNDVKNTHSPGSTVEKKNQLPSPGHALHVDQQKSTKYRVNYSKHNSVQQVESQPEQLKQPPEIPTDTNQQIPKNPLPKKHKKQTMPDFSPDLFDKNGKYKVSRKRIPQPTSQFEESFKPRKMLKVGFGVKKPRPNEEYKPFGQMERGKYPRRLTTPPLRYWELEKKNYKDGYLESVTLLADQRGQKIKKIVFKQVEKGKK